MHKKQNYESQNYHLITCLDEGIRHHRESASQRIRQSRHGAGESRVPRIPIRRADIRIGADARYDSGVRRPLWFRATMGAGNTER